MFWKPANLAFLLQFSISVISLGQNADSLQLRRMMAIADSLYDAVQYKNAIANYEKCYQWAVVKKLESDYVASRSLDCMGNCYYNLMDYSNAHTYYFRAIQQARIYDYSNILQHSLCMLHAVHSNVQQFDKSFSYPEIESYVFQPVMFTVDSLLFARKDSAVLRIAGGTYDGIDLSHTQGDLFQTYDANTKRDFRYIGKCSILQAGNNVCTISVKLKSPARVLKGYQVQLNARVPEKILNSSLKEIYLRNINWMNSSKYENMLNRRYMYYYFNENYEDEMLSLLQDDLNTTVVQFAKDTLNEQSQMHQKISEGIFKNQNIIGSLATTKKRNLVQFIHFLNEYRDSYTGLRIDFRVLYAGWALNGTPINKDDAREFLLEDESNPNQIRNRSLLLEPQIAKNFWAEKWLDEAFDKVD